MHIHTQAQYLKYDYMQVFVHICTYFGHAHSHAQAHSIFLMDEYAHTQVTLAANVQQLPNEVRAAFDPMKKRPNPKTRKKLAKMRKEKTMT